MNINEYISSGILELYVLGQLSPEEAAQVEEMQSKYTEVQQEIYAIATSLEKYARLHAITPPSGVEEKLFDQLPPKPNASIPNNQNYILSNNVWKLISILLGLGTMAALWIFTQQANKYKKEIDQLNQNLALCDSVRQIGNFDIAILTQLTDNSNYIISLAPSSTFNSTIIYLHHNSDSKKNFLQLNNLPVITKDQVFQLWSLKPGQDPIPMDIFAADKSILEIGYIDGTPTYAITIEPKGGSKIPTLTNLIGTMTI